jgi:hypothetical protein
MIGIMPRSAIIVGFAWPFIVAAIGGALLGIFGPRLEFLLTTWPLAFAGIGHVMVCVHKIWPANWTDVSRPLLTLFVSVPIVCAEVWAAVWVFQVMCVLGGGWRWV